MGKVLSVLNRTSQALQDLTRIILFEFKKYNTEEDESTYLFITMLWTLPSEINYRFPSRNKFEQMMGGGTLDKFPMGLPTIRISGTFGKNRRGLMFQDGLTRLQFFKEQVIKRYHRVREEDDPLKLNQMAFIQNPALLLVKDKLPLKDNEVYTLTLYDFINGEIWMVDPTNFEIIESARTQSNLPRYDLRLQAVGKPEGEGKMDKILMGLMSTSQIAKSAVSAAGALTGGGAVQILGNCKLIASSFMGFKP